MWCIKMYEIGDNVETIYGKGKIIKKQIIAFNKDGMNCYLIKYSLFKRRWCFENSIIKRLSRWI